MKPLKALFMISVFGCFLSTSGDGWAQDPSRPQLTQLEQQGKLVTLRLVQDQKAAKLYFVGKEAATLKIGKEALILDVTAFRDGEERKLAFKPNQESYDLASLPEWKEYELRVKAKKGKGEETLRFPMKQP